MSVSYRLERTARPLLGAPTLDESQRSVVDHPGGPLLVLAGPGTGKTTTLVEAVVDRIDGRGLQPDQVLVLTFSRKAAEELRNRITGRLGRTSSHLMSSTFHSFCYGLVRQWQPAELYSAPLRLLSAPEQDVKLRELLAHSRGSGKATWPPALEQALRTRGFAREVHAVLARARELGMEPADLAQVGSDSDRLEWVAAGAFMAEYLEVLDFEGALDYAELVHRAVLLAEGPEVREQLRRQFQAVFVDEYQDTDPMQVRLLQAIAGDGRDLVVVGDPDQSIYAFRGADVRGILDFPTEFRHADRRRADVVALSTTRRFGERLLTASRRIAGGIGVQGAIGADTFRAFRNPAAAPGEFGPGRAEVFTFSSSGAEADHIADILRRAHLEDDIPWTEMAVLVRSGVTSIPGLRRSLVAAGVPVEVAGDEVPLRAEPAVQPLLAALRGAVDLDAMSAEAARMLLTSPLGDLDAAEVRKLGRRLRRADRLKHDRLPLSSGELLRSALVDPSLLDGLDDSVAARAGKLARLLHRAHGVLASGGPAEEALWGLWSGTTWPYRLRGAVERGAGAARAADRDLDAICALFEVAAQAEEKHGHRGALVFIEEVEAQQIPADTLADRGVRGDAVRLLTAHRSKGLEWRLVAVAGVQQGSWPDLRRRGSVLQADRLGADGLVDSLTAKAMMAEERRLFYVAVTRARQRLVVTAVASPEADGDQPSRLLDDLGLPARHLPGRPLRPMSLPGLVAELRRVAADPTQRQPLRGAAAARLARLVGEEIGGQSLAPGADPANWWGLRPRTTNDTPLRPADAPLRLSASGLEAVLSCPLRWFLAKEAAGETARTTALGFGSVIHALADHMSKDDVVDKEQVLRLLDDVWGQLRFDSPWIAARERCEAEAAIDRLFAWHGSRPGRSYVGSEVDFDIEIPLEGRERVAVKGRIDRVERDTEGRVVIVDFKTSKNAPTGKSVTQNPQLGLYQLVVGHNGLASRCGSAAEPGGAELVQLRVDSGGLPKVQVQSPQAADESGRKPVEVQLISATATVRAEQFDATVNDHCKRCEFNRMCPAQQRSKTVLS
ncbi:MAG: ATP-dependent helicase [Nocardioidaceae bacterium]|nr:ATP-dependent helicase [Nocardioidaceae bacterium]